MTTVTDIVAAVRHAVQLYKDSDAICQRLETQLVDCGAEIDALQDRLQETERSNASARRKLEKVRLAKPLADGTLGPELPHEHKAESVPQEFYHSVSLDMGAGDKAAMWERRYREMQERCAAAESKILEMKPPEDSEVVIKVNAL